jgi:hypothetical protein
MNEREFVAGAQQLLRSDVWVEIERTMKPVETRITR